MDLEDEGISLSPSYRQLNNEYRFESKRLQTFQCWPIDAPIDSSRVAKAGFYFTGKGYEVQCFACGGKISQWNYGDQAVSKHRQMNPSCPFLLNRSSNVPIQLETESSIHSNSQLHLEQPSQTTASDSSNQMNRLTPNPTVSQLSAPSRSTTSSFVPLQSRPLLPSASTNHGTLLSNLSSPPLRLTHHEWLNLRSEQSRLGTFGTHYTSPFPLPSELAKAGFFYLGTADHVQCVFCRGVIKDWEINDDPHHEHERLFPNCPFVLGLPVGNVPIGLVELNNTQERTTISPHQSSSEGFDVAPSFNPEARPSAHPDLNNELGSATVQVNNNVGGSNLEDLGITKHSGPRYSSYATYESRLKSFRNWPPHLRQGPTAMAQAGFFYLGVSDHVNCFHCGSGLRNWEPEDDPWIEHARWFPQCRFLILMKGEQFIKEAAQRVCNETVSKTQRPQPPYRNAGPLSPPREISEAEILILLESPIVQTVLAMGIDLSRVKQALKLKLRTTGQPFSTVDSLLEATITLQHYNEHLLALEDSNYETVDWSELRPSFGRHETLSEATESESDLETGGSGNVSTVHETPTRPEQEQLQSAIASGTDKAAEPVVMKKEQAIVPETNKQEGTDRTQLLEEEIRRLKEARLCKVCLDEEVSIAYIPCGHIVTCTQCAAALEQCPLCRKNIKGTVKIFFS